MPSAKIIGVMISPFCFLVFLNGHTGLRAIFFYFGPSLDSEGCVRSEWVVWSRRGNGRVTLSIHKTSVRTELRYPS